MFVKCDRSACSQSHHVNNTLPGIGYLLLRKEFWVRHGANIVTRYKGTYGERLF